MRVRAEGWSRHGTSVQRIPNRGQTDGRSGTRARKRAAQPKLSRYPTRAFQNRCFRSGRPVRALHIWVSGRLAASARRETPRMPQGRFRKPGDHHARLINPARFDKSKSQAAGATNFLRRRERAPDLPTVEPRCRLSDKIKARRTGRALCDKNLAALAYGVTAPAARTSPSAIRTA